MHAEQTQIEVHNTTISNSECQEGSAFVLLGRESKLQIDDSTFVNNTALSKGGVFLSSGGSVLINNTLFLQNTANSVGGVAYLYGNTQFHIEGSSFLKNRAQEGSTIYTVFNKEVGVSTLRKTLFSYNTALGFGTIILNFVVL